MKINFYQDFKGVNFELSISKTSSWIDYKLYICFGFLFWSVTLLIIKKNKKNEKRTIKNSY